MELECCIQYMCKWYLSDTIELLDLVLNDNDEDPQYSAITTLNRFWIYLEYQKKIGDCECNNVASFLEKIGYSINDIDLFREKVRAERDIYVSDILDTTFF